jgi:nicotinamidase-related amidase
MINIKDTGLVVIDIQGKLSQIVSNSQQMMEATAKLIQGVRALNMPVVWLEQNQQKLGSTNTIISQHLDGLSPINKFTFDAFGEPSCVEAIEQAAVKKWLVCGIEAHICVYQTCSSLLKASYEVELVTDCISSRNSAHVGLAINKLQAKGANVTCLEMCLYELVQDSRGPAFSSILKLIK